MLSDDHDAAHLALDEMTDRLLSSSPPAARLGLFHLRRHLTAHMRVEERHLLPAVPSSVAAAIAKDHDDLRARLLRAEEAALDATVGALAPGRFDDELARLVALFEHHDLRERDAYAKLDLDVAWPLPPPKSDDVIPDETKIAIARYAWWHRARGENPADWQPTLPPDYAADEALRAVNLRETELLRTWLAASPGREQLGAAYRLAASLQASVGFTMRRAFPKTDP